MRKRLNLKDGNKIVLYMPLNLFHSNVSAEARQAYMVGFLSLLAMLKRSGLKIAVSAQKIDLLLLGLTEGDFEGIELIAAPFAHFLPSLVGDDEILYVNAKWQINNGVMPGSSARFNPEFDVPPQRNLLPHSGQLMPAVAPSTVGYSEGDVSDVQVHHKIFEQGAVNFNGNTLVPMIGTQDATSAWFRFQFNPSETNLELVIQEIHKIVTNGSGKVYVWYVDLEGPIVGSFHGFSLWERLFTAIQAADLGQHFVSFEDTADYFRERARKVGFSMIARDLGGKWTKWPQQLRYILKMAKVHEPQNDFDHAVMALFVVSDALSALNSKISGPITRDAVRVDGTPATIEIGYDQTIISIANRCLEEYVSRESNRRNRVLNALRDLRSTDSQLPTTPAGQFFSNRVADMLERFAV